MDTWLHHQDSKEGGGI